MGITTRRRELLVGAAGGAAAVLATGCASSSDAVGGSGLQGPKAQPGPERDAQLLDGALGLERQAVAAYAAASRFLTGSAGQLALRFRAQEEQHVARLVAAVRASRGRPSGAMQAVELPASARTARGFFAFAIQREQAFVAAYTELLPQLSDPELRAVTASILSNEAQHAAALRLRLGQPGAPQAIVTGIA